MNVELLNHIIAARWNRIVTKKMLFLREEKTHLVFLHATKGLCYVSKKRLGLA